METKRVGAFKGFFKVLMNWTHTERQITWWKTAYIVEMWALRTNIAMGLQREFDSDMKHVQVAAMHTLRKVLQHSRNREIGLAFNRMRENQRQGKSQAKTASRSRVASARMMRRVWARVQQNGKIDVWEKMKARWALHRNHKAANKILSRVVERWEHATFSMVVVTWNVMKGNCFGKKHASQDALQMMRRAVGRMQARRVAMVWEHLTIAARASSKGKAMAKRLSDGTKRLKWVIICMQHEVHKHMVAGYHSMRANWGAHLKRREAIKKVVKTRLREDNEKLWSGARMLELQHITHDVECWNHGS